jgi:hypothetical protein
MEACKFCLDYGSLLSYLSECAPELSRTCSRPTKEVHQKTKRALKIGFGASRRPSLFLVFKNAELFHKIKIGIFLVPDFRKIGEIVLLENQDFS